MPTSMTATLSVPGNIIAGSKFTCTLSLIEGGGTSTNLVSIQPYVLGGDGKTLAGGARVGAVANAATIAGYTGAAVTINASSTSIFNFEAVIDSPDMWHEGIDAVNPNYTIAAVCQTSDGSVFSPPPQVVGVSVPSTGVGAASPAANGLLNQSLILGTTTNQYSNVLGGASRFDIPANSYMLASVF